MRATLASGTPVEVARPPGEPTRGVVLVPDIMGLRPLFDDLAARLAAEHGWVVVEVEPFPGQESLAVEARLAAMAVYDHARLTADCVAAADLPGLEPVAVTGFCMGGMAALRAAATGRFDRAAAFYGMIRLPEPWRASGASDPLDDLTATPGAAATVLAVIGTADPYTPPADVEALEAAGATIARYEGADHGFVHDASRPTHRAADAADAWTRVGDWFSGRGW